MLFRSKRRDFYLYVDEFQNFATDAFCNILSEARKYRLALILGNQYLAQLDEMTPTGRSTRIRDAIFGNVGTIISFRVGAEDAEYLEKELIPEFTAADLVNLGKYNTYLKLMIDGLSGRPFSAETLAPLPRPEKSSKEKIIKVSRERYGTQRKIVEDKISRWSGMVNLPETFPIQAQSPERSEGWRRTNVLRDVSQVLYDAKCFLCGKDTKVIFQPDGTRPVYCKACLKKVGKSPPVRPEPIIVKLPERPDLSLKEALESPPVPFSQPKKNREEKPKPKRKEVNLDELKKVLEKSLDQNQENKT